MKEDVWVYCRHFPFCFLIKKSFFSPSGHITKACDVLRSIEEFKHKAGMVRLSPPLLSSHQSTLSADDWPAFCSSGFSSGHHVLPRGGHRQRHRRFQTGYWPLPVATGWCITMLKSVDENLSLFTTFFLFKLSGHKRFWGCFDQTLCFVSCSPAPLHTWRSCGKLPITSWSTAGRRRPSATWSSCGSESQLWSIWRDQRRIAGCISMNTQRNVPVLSHSLRIAALSCLSQGSETCVDVI